MSPELATLPFLAPSTMDQALAFANQMSQARLLPAHLQKSPADCLRVVLQAARWQMDPFAVADKTSIIQNKLMYEGQLVSAVVNARGNLSKRLSYDYAGEGDNRTLTVSGTVKGEAEPRTIELPFSLAKRINKNGQMQTNPDQQAAYIGARIWARRHMPELMLGVYTPDEIDETDEPKNVTPEGEQPKVERPEPPKRTPRGAKAVTQEATVVTAVSGPTVNEAALKPGEVLTPAEAPKPVEPVPATPPPQPPGDSANAPKHAAPAAVGAMPKLTLKDGEIFEAVVTVDKSGGMWIRVDDVPRPSVSADISGEFKGEVFHKNIGDLGPDGKPLVGTDKKPLVPKIWAKGNKLKVTLRGYKNMKARYPATIDPVTKETVPGALLPDGKMMVFVDSAVPVDATIVPAEAPLEEF